MRSFLVVKAEPLGEEVFGFAEGVDQLAIQAFHAEAAVEAFDIPVLPRAAGVDVDGADLGLLQPFTDLARNELRPVVRADVGRCAVLRNGPLQHRQDVSGLQLAGGVDRVAFARVFINEVEHLQGATALRVVAHEVPRPDMVTALGLRREARRDALTTRLFLRWRHLQTFFAAQPLHALFPHAIARLA